MSGRETERVEEKKEKNPIFKRAKDHESAAEKKKDQIDLEMSKFNDGEIFTHFWCMKSFTVCYLALSFASFQDA